MADNCECDICGQVKPKFVTHPANCCEDCLDKMIEENEEWSTPEFKKQIVQVALSRCKDTKRISQLELIRYELYKDDGK